MTIGETGERLRRCTVQVRNGANSGGSGIVWPKADNAPGLIVTNAHVIRSAGKGNLTVELWDGRTLSARLEKRDVRRDLAILRVERTPATYPATPGDSSRLRVGESSSRWEIRSASRALSAPGLYMGPGQLWEWARKTSSKPRPVSRLVIPGGRSPIPPAA